MNPLGPQRKKVGESRSVTLWETNSSVRRPLRPLQVASGLDRHNSYLTSGGDLQSLESWVSKMISATVRTQYRRVPGSPASTALRDKALEITGVTPLRA